MASGALYSYNPSTQDRSGEIFAQGITSAGKSIAGGIDKWKEQREENDFMTSSMDVLSQQYPDVVTPEMLEKFHSGSAGAKRGVLTQAMTGVKRQMEEQDRERDFEQWQAKNPQFGSQGQETFTLPDGSSVMVDKATGRTIGQGKAPKAAVTPESMEMFRFPDSKYGIGVVNGEAVTGALPVFDPDMPEASDEGPDASLFEQFAAQGLQPRGATVKTKQGTLSFAAPTPPAERPARPIIQRTVDKDGLEKIWQYDPKKDAWRPATMTDSTGPGPAAPATGGSRLSELLKRRQQ